jgi:hypothetical protein
MSAAQDVVLMLLLNQKGTGMSQDGKLMKKRNTFVDFIAAAEHLIKVCTHLFQQTHRCVLLNATQQHAVKVERSVQRDNCHRRKVLSSRTAAKLSQASISTAAPKTWRRRSPALYSPRHTVDHSAAGCAEPQLTRHNSNRQMQQRSV